MKTITFRPGNTNTNNEKISIKNIAIGTEKS